MTGIITGIIVSLILRSQPSSSPETMDNPLSMKKPKISEKSRVFKKHNPASSSKAKDKGKQAVQSKNAGKLATLMDITLDVFFEVHALVLAYLRLAQTMTDCDPFTTRRLTPALSRIEAFQNNLHEQVCTNAVGCCTKECRCHPRSGSSPGHERTSLRRFPVRK